MRLTGLTRVDAAWNSGTSGVARQSIGSARASAVSSPMAPDEAPSRIDCRAGSQYPVTDSASELSGVPTAPSGGVVVVGGAAPDGVSGGVVLVGAAAVVSGAAGGAAAVADVVGAPAAGVRGTAGETPDVVGARRPGQPTIESRSAILSPPTGRASTVTSATTMSEVDFGIGGTEVVVSDDAGGVVVVVGVGGAAGEVVVVPGSAEDVSGPGVDGVAAAAAVLDGIGPRPGGKVLAPESATTVVPMPAAVSSETRTLSRRP